MYQDYFEIYNVEAYVLSSTFHSAFAIIIKVPKNIYNGREIVLECNGYI